MANKHRTEADHGDNAYTLTSRHMTAHRELTDWHEPLLLRGHLSMELAELFAGLTYDNEYMLLQQSKRHGGPNNTAIRYMHTFSNSSDD